jgi:hypothetical protein
MKDAMDKATADLFDDFPPNIVPEFEGISYTLYADHEHEVISIIENRTNASYVFYDQSARDFWHDYVAELKINGFNADDALETMWEQYDEL